MTVFDNNIYRWKTDEPLTFKIQKEALSYEKKLHSTIVVTYSALLSLELSLSSQALL